MGKFLKKFETDSDRVEYEGSENYLEPYVSYVEGDNTVHYNKPKETRVVATFNVTSASEPTKIGYNVSNVDKIEIDGVLLDSVVNSYTFDTLGEHTIMYTLKDSTDLKNVPYMSCPNLVSITIPEGVTNIGSNAFAYCSNLTSVTIPDSVTNIGISAFGDCKSLTSVTVEATTPPTLGESAFQGVSGCKYYVPAESVDAYKTAEGWTYYASKIQAIPTQSFVL